MIDIKQKQAVTRAAPTASAPLDLSSPVDLSSVQAVSFAHDQAGLT